MPNANLSLNYGVTKRITVTGKSASGAAKPVTNITYSVVNYPQISIVPVAGSLNQFDATNTSQGASGSASITFSAQNELGNNISGVTPVTLVPADPATTLETTYSDPV